MSECDCFKGTCGDRNYQPAGAVNQLDGFHVYQTKARADTQSKGHILILPDGFGLAIHNIILADKFATYGYDVSILDYYQGKALPDIFLEYTPGTDLDNSDRFTEEEKSIIRGVDLERWARENNPEMVHKQVVPFVEKLKESLGPTNKLYLVGHCFGGVQAFELANKVELSTAIVILHPAPYKLHGVNAFRVPLFIGLAESDQFAPNAPQDISQAFATTSVYYKIAIYGGTKHGFASRADLNDELARKAYDSSIRDTMDWINHFSD
ncbi:dienelactone hydrolase [Aspergillus keveii]|uniref:Dienelactone hydrolase n=1 Tax=Aspergillus keveii TaxID=714993 RepID=A0ABR4FJ39_9EURO